MERSGLCDSEDGGLKAPDFVEIMNAANQE